MKCYKKIISVLFALILLLAMVLPAAASSTNVTKNQIMSELNSGVKVSGQVKYFPNKYVKLASDVLYTESFSQSELNYIMDQLLTGKSIWAESGQLNYEQMSSEYQSKLRSLGSATANHLGMTITLSGEEVKIVSKSGKVYTTDAYVDPSNGKGVIKKTGVDMNVVPIIAVASSFVVLAIIGALIILWPPRRREC